MTVPPRAFDPAWQTFAPRLTGENCVAHSDPTEDYNCLAFAAGQVQCWWEPYIIPPMRPGIYWPAGVTPDNTVEAWCEALATVGFAVCGDTSHDSELVKVVVYRSGDTATHAARQLRDGRWVSKLGDEADVIHLRPEDVGGGIYGEVACVLARRRLPEDL